MFEEIALQFARFLDAISSDDPDASEQFLDALRPASHPPARLRPPLDDAIDRLLALVQRELRRILTSHAMTLQLPAGVVVRLGSDVAGEFPASLAAVSVPRLAALLDRIDPNTAGAAGSGAADWSELTERIHLIADLFRCRHEWEPLFEPPFTAAQLETLRAGRPPAGPL